jgi:hypothetical protein
MIRTARRTTIAGLVFAAGALAGCSSPQTGLFPQFGLYFNQDDQAADLAYGRANSDDVAVMLQCAKGSRQVQLTDVAPAKPHERLELTSGTQRMSLPARLWIDDTGAPLAQAILPMDAPVLRDFRRSGTIAVSLGGLRYGLKARRDEQDAVSRFFTACERS